jgi:short-subunit dehydrogenase
VTSARRALITGGSAGLGKAFREALLADGYHVTSIDRSQVSDDAQLAHISCDLSERDAVDRLVAQLAGKGPFDVVILNAGVSATGQFEKIPIEAHRRLLALNAEAPLVLTAALAEQGGLAEGGRVVFISSLSHQTGYPGAASYAASKDTVAAYAKSIRKPFRRDLDVAVCCAFTGPLRTDHAARHAPDGSRVEGRMEPEEAARLILAGAAKGQAVIIPGFGAKLFAIAGSLFPGPVTRIMRRLIYARLERDVF